MTSLTEQMEELQTQQAILAGKIILEQKTQTKLEKLDSIERLEVLIGPISQHLDWIHPGHHNTRTKSGMRSEWSLRQNFTDFYENEKNKLEKYLKNGRGVSNNYTMYKCCPMLANEEIFVTLMGIIKKQDERIKALEDAN